jgi:hypothetical protein
MVGRTSHCSLTMVSLKHAGVALMTHVTADGPENVLKIVYIVS